VSLLRRFTHVLWSNQAFDLIPPLTKLRGSSEYDRSMTNTRSGSSVPLVSLGSLLDFRVFANLGFRSNPRAVTAPLASFTLFLRVHQRSSGLTPAPVSRDASSAPPVESLAPSVFPHMEQRLFPGSGLHGRRVGASRFSQPPDAFIRPMSASLIACWIHAWGSTLQSFPPPVQPYAVSDAVALLSL
jgi:hypothetical protein